MVLYLVICEVVVNSCVIDDLIDFDVVLSLRL